MELVASGSRQALEAERRQALEQPAMQAALAQALEDLIARHGAYALDRVLACFDIASGKVPPPYRHELQRPALLFFPGLPVTPWYSPDDYPALRTLTSELERGFEAIRQDIVPLIERDDAWSDYVQGDYAQHKFFPLTGKTWTALTIRDKGRPVTDVRAACPRTAEIVDRIEPMLTATGEVFFSLLHPGVVLPPHHDDSNAKLTVHLPLVVPPDCAIAVGGERRTWVEGKCLAFDDTFVHEAWNRSDRVRVCLLLDVWHPCLTEVEIDALSQLSKLLFTAC